MNDIILIDDNSKNQRAAYGALFVDEEDYAEILSHIEKVKSNIDPSFLDGSKCVLIHDSLEDFINGKFDQYSHVAKDVIVNYLENKGIPYVCFSDGHESTGVYDDDGVNLVSLKKSSFYNRLKYFLDYYRAENMIEFRILAYGRNFRKEIMLRFVKALFKKLEMKRSSEILMSSDVMPVKIGSSSEKAYLEEIIFLSQPILGMTYNEILDYIDDEEISVGEFRERINKILISVSKNGKNTYTWE